MKNLKFLKLIYISFIVLSINHTHCMQEDLKEQIKDIVCKGHNQLFKDYPDFDKTFLINLRGEPVLAVSEVEKTNLPISKEIDVLFSADWFSRSKGFMEAEGKLKVYINLNINKTANQLAEMFKPETIHKLFNILKFQKKYEPKGLALLAYEQKTCPKDLSKQIPNNLKIEKLQTTSDSIKTIMGLPQQRIIKIIKYIQAAYDRSLFIKHNIELEYWLKSKNISISDLKMKPAAWPAFKNKILNNPKDKRMLDALNAFLEAREIWKAIGIIAQVATQCEVKN